MSNTTKHYAKRDPDAQGIHYINHVFAMTTEGLHAKSAIAAELAHRDIEIERLRAALVAPAEAAAPAKAGEQKRLPLAITSAPERIWLDLGFNPYEDNVHFSNPHDLTWSQDNATGGGVEYVRADLAALLAAQAAPAPSASIEQEAMQMLWNDQQQEEKQHYRNVARGAERIK